MSSVAQPVDGAADTAAPLTFALHMGMYVQPPVLPESAWTGHIPFAGWLVDAMKPRLFVELGTHRGASYLAFCEALSMFSGTGRAYAVDTWEGDKHTGLYGDEVFATLSDHHNGRYGEFSKLMRMTFDDAARYFDPGTVDLLHIDGLHTYDAVRNDFETWLPKLSERGVVLFHDIGVREREFGVWRFWDECKARYPFFEFTHSHGLGVLLVGREAPRPVRDLCALSSEQAGLVAALFARLGAAFDDRAERARLALALNHEQSAAGRRASATASAVVQALEPAVSNVEGVLRQDLAHVNASVGSALAHVQGALSQGMADVRGAIDSSVMQMQDHVAGIRVDIANKVEQPLNALQQLVRDVSADHGRELSTTLMDAIRTIATSQSVASGNMAEGMAEIERQMDRSSALLTDIQSTLASTVRRLDEIVARDDERERRRWMSRLRALFT